MLKLLYAKLLACYQVGVQEAFKRITVVCPEVNTNYPTLLYYVASLLLPPALTVVGKEIRNTEFSLNPRTQERFVWEKLR